MDPATVDPPRPPQPPFDQASARTKVQAAEDAWNTRDPERVAAAYTADTVWRNRSEFLTGRGAVVQFLRAKWDREHDYALRKSLWAYTDDRIAVRFQYEWHDDDGQCAAGRSASTSSSHRASLCLTAWLLGPSHLRRRRRVIGQRHHGAPGR